MVVGSNRAIRHGPIRTTSGRHSLALFGALFAAFFAMTLLLFWGSRIECKTSEGVASLHLEPPSGSALHEGAGERRAEAAAEKKPIDPDDCRDAFVPKGQGGGLARKNPKRMLRACARTPLVFDVCDDLRNFTGLAEDEFLVRMARRGRFHFEAEHNFWNPTSMSELAWYYSTSVDYLFANALHGVWESKIKMVASKEYEPVLDYSGSVGNNVLYLASRGIKSRYFGIGMMEYQFAQYRVWKRGMEHLVEFKRPYSAATGFSFDPINGPLPRDATLGAIIAMDVFEHIPNYHLVVEAMVESLRVGGIIIEVTPFSESSKNTSMGSSGSDEDLRVHLSNGGVSMEEAMGPKMKKEGKKWVKIAE